MGTSHGLHDYTCVRKCGFYPLGILKPTHAIVHYLALQHSWTSIGSFRGLKLKRRFHQHRTLHSNVTGQVCTCGQLC